MENGMLGGAIIGGILCAVLTLVIMKLSKKTDAELKEILSNVSEDTKHLMQNQTYSKTDKKNIFTTNGYVYKSEEKNGNTVALLLFYSDAYDDYYTQKIKIKSSDPKSKNIKVGDFISTVMKYDKDCHLYRYVSLG